MCLILACAAAQRFRTTGASVELEIKYTNTVTGVTYDTARFEAVRLHNGVRFAEMPHGFHAELAAQTLALFHGQPFLGDGFLKALAAAAGLDPAAAPSIQALTPEPAHA